MASKKEFMNVNTESVYGQIAEATSPAAGPAKEKKPARKPRRTYTEEEKDEILQTLQTAGRKGIKLPRINLAFAPDVHEYVQTMSRASGQNLTQFVNHVLRQHMEEHKDLYDQAIKFRESL